MSIMARSFTYRHFDAFCFLLSILVFLQHYLENLAPQPLATATLPYGFGSVTVLIFFCLSGFVIAEAAVEFYRAMPGAFMTNRVRGRDLRRTPSSIEDGLEFAGAHPPSIAEG